MLAAKNKSIEVNTLQVKQTEHLDTEDENAIGKCIKKSTQTIQYHMKN